MLQVFKMCLQALLKYDNVVQVRQRKIPLDCVEDYVHCRLKSTRRVLQPKWHTDELVQPITFCEASFHFLSLAILTFQEPLLASNVETIVMSPTSLWTGPYMGLGTNYAMWLHSISYIAQKILACRPLLLKRQFLMQTRLGTVWWL